MTRAFDWTGAVGETWAAEWRRTDRSFSELSPILDAAIRDAAPPGACRIVDIGCGAGGTALAIAEARLDAKVIGIDLSAGLVAVARERAGSRAVDFRCGDVLGLVGALAPVELFVSRHGVMFFADPVAAFAALARGASPGARLIFSCFAERAANRWACETLTALGADGYAPTGDAPGPFAFADPSRVAVILSRGGWRPDAPRRIDFRYIAGQGADPVTDACDFLQRIGPAASLLRDAAPADRAALFDRLAAVCAAHRDRVRDGVRVGDRVTFPAAAWIWSATLSESQTQ